MVTNNALVIHFVKYAKKRQPSLEFEFEFYFYLGFSFSLVEKYPECTNCCTNSLLFHPLVCVLDVMLPVHGPNFTG
jgi:hypothetical protein